ncbi:MAG: hypothetical protein Kow0063_00570 [Anaerolineae bacterium]
MYVKRDWSISIDEKEYIAQMSDSFARLLQTPAKIDTFQSAVKEVKEAIEPAACWDRFPIQKFLHDKLVLANGVRLGGGPVVSVMGGAEELIVAVCTIGPAADRLIEEAQKTRQLFRALVLNDLAAWAVDIVRQQLCRCFEEEAKEQGLHISAPLSPGESAWSVQDQAVIFSLLDAGQINVSLSPSMVMSPVKSLSLILGVGSRAVGIEGASNCDFCTIKERCAYQHLRPYGRQAMA